MNLPAFLKQICCPNIISNALNNRLAGAKAIVARAQPLGKDTMFNKFLINNVTKLKVPFYTRLRKKKNSQTKGEAGHPQIRSRLRFPLLTQLL